MSYNGASMVLRPIYNFGQKSEIGTLFFVSHIASLGQDNHENNSVWYIMTDGKKLKWLISRAGQPLGGMAAQKFLVLRSFLLKVQCMYISFNSKDVTNQSARTDNPILPFFADLILLVR